MRPGRPTPRRSAAGGRRAGPTGRRSAGSGPWTNRCPGGPARPAGGPGWAPRGSQWYGWGWQWRRRACRYGSGRRAPTGTDDRGTTVAWDFSTEPEFEEQLAWMRQMVRDQIIPLETLSLSHEAMLEATE